MWGVLFHCLRSFFFFFTITYPIWPNGVQNKSDPAQKAITILQKDRM
jgi:hypothetical protein